MMESSTMKNATRIASLMGTWTGQTKMKASIGHYEVLAYFNMHLMPNTMRGYGCEIDGNVCKEIDNRLCVSSDKNEQECVNTESEVVNWSDGTS
jgi:hypothetical protein